MSFSLHLSDTFKAQAPHSIFYRSGHLAGLRGRAPHKYDIHQEMYAVGYAHGKAMRLYRIATYIFCGSIAALLSAAIFLA